MSDGQADVQRTIDADNTRTGPPQCNHTTMKGRSMYLENPKTKGSGIVCCIPQTGTCPNKCEDCFFQSGRSYLEPLADNLPNMPDDIAGRVVRVNDGNDSNVHREVVIASTDHIPMRFFNTAIPRDLAGFPGPVVLTLNPGNLTDSRWHLLSVPPINLMFVRYRVNTWNTWLADEAVRHYTGKGVPVVLTFMAYFDTADHIPVDHREHYAIRKRTLNEYWAITNTAWRMVMDRFASNPLVHSCGMEGIPGGSSCKNCGNCLREYFATVERMRASE